MIPFRVLRSVLLPAFLVSALSLGAADFQFDDTGVTASVTPSATTYWMCSCIGTFSGSTLLANYYAILSDADGDGVVRWELGDEMKPGGLWTMIDGAAGTITTRARNGSAPAPLAFPSKAFLRDEHGTYSRFVVNPTGSDPYLDGYHLFWVRPGVGAWKKTVFDHGPFDEMSASPKVMIDVSGLDPVEASAPAPAGFQTGDVLILMDDHAAYWTGDRVDAHLTESIGPGVIDFASTQGDEDAQKAVVTLVRTEGTDGAASLHYTTADVTAVAGTHYQPSSGMITFDHGQIFRSFEVPLVDDQTDSGSRTFRVALSDASGAAIGTATTDVTIADNDDTPYVTIEERVVNEGDDGPKEVAVRVFLNHTAPKPVSLEWRAYDRILQTTLETGVLELAAGEKEKTITIHYIADDRFGYDRSIGIAITNATNATPTREGRLRIIEDDPAPVLTLEGTVVRESDGVAEVTLRLSAPLAFSGGWSFNTEAGSAMAANDFTARTGVVQLPTGETAVKIAIPIHDDTVAEGTESFEVVLPVGLAAPAPVKATVTILDDDATRRRAVRH